MKKVSAKAFFTVLWRGLCQALGWFFGLFGYKRDGKFARCVWGLFATSATVIVCIIAIATLYDAGVRVRNWYSDHHINCKDPDCWASTCIDGDIYYHDYGEGKRYIFNKRTGEKLIKHVQWIAESYDEDTLVCFSNGEKRGYFSKKTGEVVIEPKYDHAWIFSEGLASVDEGGFIKFIDGTGKVVIDKNMSYRPGMEGYVFHGGYCVINSDDGESQGLIDKRGNIILPLEYDSIELSDDYELWSVEKGEETAVFDKDLHPVIPFTECSIYINDGTIDMTMPDHTIRKYDMEGNLLNDFYIYSFSRLDYETDEIVYQKTTDTDDEECIDSYHPRATARLRSYSAAGGYEGLATADGHIVTKPLYQDIEAIGYDLYLCTSTNYDKLIVNGKGEIVK